MSRLAWMAWIGTALLVACGDGVGLEPEEPEPWDAGNVMTPGVCKLKECPTPPLGVACCTPGGSCGMDPTVTGLVCMPNPGRPLTENECVLAECPLPSVGNPCCTPFGTCGFDPYGTGLSCFANPPVDRRDAAVPPPNCPEEKLATCPLPDVGFSCCTNDGECGVDPWGNGLCFPPAGDAGTPPPIDTEPPDDPSVTGECPSYLGAVGPVWGCCSEYKICGTFGAGTCLLPIGTPLPVGPPPDADAGIAEPFLRCTPPEPEDPN